jgi:hypothetical protein
MDWIVLAGPSTAVDEANDVVDGSALVDFALDEKEELALIDVNKTSAEEPLNAFSDESMFAPPSALDSHRGGRTVGWPSWPETCGKAQAHIRVAAFDGHTIS